MKFNTVLHLLRIKRRMNVYDKNFLTKGVIYLISILFLWLAVFSLPFAEEFNGASTNPDDYKIGPEDVLFISVWKEEELQREVLVRPDGGISFPLAGDVHVEGKTPL